MTDKHRKTLLIILMFLSCFLLNYNPQMLFKTHFMHWGWSLSLLSSVLIVLLMRVRSPNDWKQQLGIDFNLNDLFLFLIATLCVLALSYYLVSYVAGLSGFSLEPLLFNYKSYYSPGFPFSAILANYLYFIPQTFNEEMLIGAVFLFGLEKKLKTTSSALIAMLVALFFSLMHQVLYRFSPAQPGITLTYTTLSTLFFVGVLRNALILKTRKIVYSWAIHLSFNFIFFPGFFINRTTGDFASEPEKFNIAFGNWPMFLFTLVLAVLSLYWLNGRKIFNRLP